jgi:hypothetical protein
MAVSKKEKQERLEALYSPLVDVAKPHLTGRGVRNLGDLYPLNEGQGFGQALKHPQRNPPPMDPVLQEMQQKVKGLSPEAIEFWDDRINNTLFYPSGAFIPGRNQKDLTLRDVNKWRKKHTDMSVGEVAKYAGHIRKLGKQGYTFENGGQLMLPQYAKGGGIHIKPSKRGTFTAAAKRRGKTVQGFASQVMRNTDNYSPAMVKKANFARNAAKWKKELGGYLDQELNNPIIDETPIDSSLVPQTQFGCGGKLMRHEIGGQLLGLDPYHGLPEYAFGSWLGDNAGGLLKGAGSIAQAFPPIGTIVGPVLNVAGSVVDSVKAKNDAESLAEEERQAEELSAKRTSYENRLRSPDEPVAPELALGGSLMEQENGFPAPTETPVITGYNGNSNTHQQGVGGVPVDSRGNPSAVSRQSAVGLTEKGEVTWNGYVFSDKLKV